MKRNYFILLSFVLLGFISCQKESIAPNTDSTTKVVWKGLVINEKTPSIVTDEVDDTDHGGIIDPDTGTSGHPNKINKVRMK